MGGFGWLSASTRLTGVCNGKPRTRQFRNCRAARIEHTASSHDISSGKSQTRPLRNSRAARIERTASFHAQRQVINPSATEMRKIARLGSSVRLVTNELPIPARTVRHNWERPPNGQALLAIRPTTERKPTSA